MNFLETIFIIFSFLAIFICLFTIWLAIIFYQRYTQFSLIVTEIAKGLDLCTKRLERLPKILYDQELILPENHNADTSITPEAERTLGTQLAEQIDTEKGQDTAKNNNKKLKKSSSEKILRESEEI